MQQLWLFFISLSNFQVPYRGWVGARMVNVHCLAMVLTGELYCLCRKRKIWARMYPDDKRYLNTFQGIAQHPLQPVSLGLPWAKKMFVCSYECALSPNDIKRPYYHAFHAPLTVNDEKVFLSCGWSQRKPSPCMLSLASSIVCELTQMLSGNFFSFAPYQFYCVVVVEIPFKFFHASNIKNKTHRS